MKVFVSVKTGKRETKVEQIDRSYFAVTVKARAEKGRANEEVIAALAEHFDIPRSNIEIISGHASRNKIIRCTIPPTSAKAIAGTANP